MSSFIVGASLASGQKVLRRTQSSSEVDGLVTLTETYSIRIEDIGSLEPERNTTHSSFSTATTKYPRMLVETTRVEPMDGGIANLVVTYVGLDYASGLPPAYITAVGQPGVGVFGANAAVVVKYITQDSLFDVLKGGNVGLNLGSSSLTLTTKRLIPTSINGTTMPPNPRAREYRRSRNASELQAAATLAFEAYLRANPIPAGSGSIAQPPIVRYAPKHEWLYAGYIQSGISFQRRGLFNQIEEQFTEYFRATDIFYQTDGTIDFAKVNSFSEVNFTF
jgi:hypothetical protein